MMKRFTPLGLLGGVVSLLALINLLLFDLRFFQAPLSLQVQFIPDDAYYYLLLAKHYALTGHWTFDGGISSTSGFHPLFAYLLYTLYTLTQPTVGQFVSYALLLSSTLTLTLAVVAWLIGLRQSRYPAYLFVLALLLTSKNVIYNSISVMEWPLVVVMSSAYLGYFAYSSHQGRPRHALLLAVGVLGSLSRSDFALLPLTLFLAALLARMIFRKNEGMVAYAASGMAGTLLGLMLVFAHNYMFSGSFMQSSAMMKSHWAQVQGLSYGPAFHLPILLWGLPWQPALVGGLLSMWLSASIILLRRGWKRWRQQPGQVISQGSYLDGILLLTSLLCVGGYLTAYCHNGAIQPWYTSQLVVPFFVLLTISLRYIQQAVTLPLQRGMRVAFTVAFLLLVGRNPSLFHPPVEAHSLWPHQKALLQVGTHLRTMPLPGRVGAWNAGMLGYYSGSRVVNLDGLVNDDIYPYAVSNRLPDYLRQQRILYIVDFEGMLSDQTYRRRGGYDDELFLASLDPVIHFEMERVLWGGRLVLYRVHNLQAREQRAALP